MIEELVKPSASASTITRACKSDWIVFISNAAAALSLSSPRASGGLMSLSVVLR